MKPQCRQVLDHMVRHGFITHMRAEAAYGITRVASRIDDLKKLGYEIDVEMMSTVNRYGKPARFAQYSLTPNQPDIMDKVHAEIEDAMVDNLTGANGDNGMTIGSGQGDMFERQQVPW